MYCEAVNRSVLEETEPGNAELHPCLTTESDRGRENGRKARREERAGERHNAALANQKCTGWRRSHRRKVCIAGQDREQRESGIPAAEALG